VVADAGPHPNPRKAAEGYRLRVLAIEDASAEVVRRIVAEYLDGKGDRAIANGLNRDGIPCPSARRPDQNRHRLADGWQGSTVRAILDNPRYTGYAFFGRWTKHETLLDPDDVAAGHVIRFRRAAPDRVVRSREQAHPAIVSVEEFTQAQLLRRSKAAGGLRTARKTERSGRRTKRSYLWIGHLFDRTNVDRTVAALVASQDGGAESAGHEAAKKRLTDAEARLRRFQAAIASGVDPAALVDVINEAQAQKAAARAELDGAPAPNLLTDAEVYAMVDSLGDVDAALANVTEERLADLYAAVNLQVGYEPAANAADVGIRLGRRVNNDGVRG
jgi:hypothetical protein